MQYVNYPNIISLLHTELRLRNVYNRCKCYNYDVHDVIHFNIMLNIKGGVPVGQQSMRNCICCLLMTISSLLFQ